MDIFGQGFQEVHSLLHTTDTPRIQPGGHQDVPMATSQRPLCHEKASEGDQGEHDDNVLCADIPEVFWAAGGGKNKIPK